MAAQYRTIRTIARRLSGRKARLEQEDTEKLIGDIFGLPSYLVEATMADGAKRTATVYAETWQATARKAEALFAGAVNITIQGGTDGER